MHDAREMTAEEVQHAFMSHLATMVRYWGGLDESSTKLAETGRDWRLWGMMHSFLCLLDGVSGGFPAFEIVPSPHPDDKEFCREEGENWWPQPPPEIVERAVTVHSGEYLHDLMYNYESAHA